MAFNIEVQEMCKFLPIYSFIAQVQGASTGFAPGLGSFHLSVQVSEQVDHAKLHSTQVKCNMSN